MFKNEIYISDNHILEDYLGIKLTMQSSKSEWKRAINIFIDRMQGRYFDVINKLSNTGDKTLLQKYGFSIMCIQCLLIDTLVKFRYGPTVLKRGTLSYNYENQNHFTKFLKEVFYEDFNNEMALKFYTDIRCGIMHFGTTKRNSRLTCDSSHLITKIEGVNISVDISVLEERLEQYFKQYIEEIKRGNQTELRENFIIAMNYICNIYQKDEKWEI